MANRLEKEKSPYLLQHKENPVDWYPWGEEAFQRAKQEDKPVFLSIGYSTCHWCHVMAHESFEDEEVAEVLNRSFVCMKVDREERPDVDAVYMSVCQAVTGSGGWPLTVFLTPEQKPFFVGTYFPKYGRYGQPGLIGLLNQVAQLWKQQRQALLGAGNEITRVINQSGAGSGKEPRQAIIDTVYHQLQRRFDARWGGFGAAPKFPTPHSGLSKAIVTDTDLVVILLKIAVWELCIERLSVGDQLYGAKLGILGFVNGWDHCRCLLIGLATIIPAAKVAALGKSFGWVGVSHRRFVLFDRSP